MHDRGSARRPSPHGPPAAGTLGCRSRPRATRQGLAAIGGAWLLGIADPALAAAPGSDAVAGSEAPAAYAAAAGSEAPAGEPTTGPVASDEASEAPPPATGDEATEAAGDEASDASSGDAASDTGSGDEASKPAATDEAGTPASDDTASDSAATDEASPSEPAAAPGEPSPAPRPPRIDGTYLGGTAFGGVGFLRVNDFDTPGAFASFGGTFTVGQMVFPWLGLGLHLGGGGSVRSQDGARQRLGQGHLGVQFKFVPFAKRHLPLSLLASFGFGGGAVRQEGIDKRSGFGGAQFGAAVRYELFPWAAKRRPYRGGGFGLGPELGWVGFTPAAPGRPTSNVFYLALSATFYFGD